MPRKPRLFLPGATYHVYCRVARGEFVFEDDFEAIEFVETLRKVNDLPWWSRPEDLDEIADPERHPEATAYDGTGLAENRVEIDLDDFTLRFEQATGLTVRDLAARSRSKNQVRGRIEYATLAISRYGYRVCDVADLIHKHRSSVTLWLNKGLFNEHNNPEFARRLNHLDEQISLRR